MLQSSDFHNLVEVKPVRYGSEREAESFRRRGRGSRPSKQVPIYFSRPDKVHRRVTATDDALRSTVHHENVEDLLHEVGRVAV